MRNVGSPLSVRLFLSHPTTRVSHLGTTAGPGLVPTDDRFTNSARVHYHGGMSRFHRDDAPSLVRAARQDASLTQAELAGMTGMSQSTLAQIESGRRAVSAELLERILRAADYRPSVPLARYASSISSYAQERGLGFLRVFGSVARGTDGSSQTLPDRHAHPRPVAIRVGGHRLVHQRTHRLPDGGPRGYARARGTANCR